MNQRLDLVKCCSNVAHIATSIKKKNTPSHLCIMSAEDTKVDLRVDEAFNDVSVGADKQHNNIFGRLC